MSKSSNSREPMGFGPVRHGQRRRPMQNSPLSRQIEMEDFSEESDDTPTLPPPKKKATRMSDQAFIRLAQQNQDNSNDLRPLRRDTPRRGAGRGRGGRGARSDDSDGKSDPLSSDSSDSESDSEDEDEITPRERYIISHSNENPDLSDLGMTRPEGARFRSAVVHNESYPYAAPHPQADLEEIFQFSREDPDEAKKRKIRKAKKRSRRQQLMLDAAAVPISTKGSRGSGFGVLSSSAKYAEKLRRQAEIEMRNRNALAESDIVHRFTRRDAVAPMIHGERREDWMVRRAAIDDQKAQFRKGFSGKIRKGRVAHDPSKVKRNYKFKDGRPSNPRKRDRDNEDDEDDEGYGGFGGGIGGPGAGGRGTRA